MILSWSVALFKYPYLLTRLFHAYLNPKFSSVNFLRSIQFSFNLLFVDSHLLPFFILFIYHFRSLLLEFTIWPKCCRSILKTLSLLQHGSVNLSFDGLFCFPMGIEDIVQWFEISISVCLLAGQFVLSRATPTIMETFWFSTFCLLRRICLYYLAYTIPGSSAVSSLEYECNHSIFFWFLCPCDRFHSCAFNASSTGGLAVGYIVFSPTQIAVCG